MTVFGWREGTAQREGTWSQVLAPYQETSRAHLGFICNISEGSSLPPVCPSSHNPLQGYRAKRTRSGTLFPATGGWKANKSQSKQRSRNPQTAAATGSFQATPAKGKLNPESFPGFSWGRAGLPTAGACFPLLCPLSGSRFAPPPQAIFAPGLQSGTQGRGPLTGCRLWGNMALAAAGLLRSSILDASPKLQMSRNRPGGRAGDHRQARYSARRLSGRTIFPPPPRASQPSRFLCCALVSRPGGGGAARWGHGATRAGTGLSSWPAGLVLSLFCGELSKRPFLDRNRTCKMQL